MGLAASLVAFPVLVAAAARRFGTPEVVGAAVFASSLVALYLVSTLYHALRPSRAKQVLQKLDHTAIYLLIAGSYTPFTLGVLRGPWGWTLFSLVWAIAGTGIALEFALGKRVHKLAVGLYVAMGWLVVVAVEAPPRVGPLAGARLARGGRPPLHGGSGLLRGEAGALRAHGLAPLRPRRERLPLRGDPRVVGEGLIPERCGPDPAGRNDLMLNILWTILIGFVVGVIAKLLHPGKENMGLIVTTLLGIAGSLVATFLGRLVGFYKEGEAAGFLMALVGAIVLLVIYGIAPTSAIRKPAASPSL